MLPLSPLGGTSLLPVQGPGAAATGREQARGIKAVASYRTPKRPIFTATTTLILVAASEPPCEN